MILRRPAVKNYRCPRRYRSGTAFQQADEGISHPPVFDIENPMITSFRIEPDSFMPCFLNARAAPLCLRYRRQRTGIRYRGSDSRLSEWRTFIKPSRHGLPRLAVERRAQSLRDPYENQSGAAKALKIFGFLFPFTLISIIILA